MPEIDLEPRRHSSSYELKPESRWWLVASIALALLMTWAAGFFEATTWAVFLAGMIVAVNAVLCFPQFFLSKGR